MTNMDFFQVLVNMHIRAMQYSRQSENLSWHMSKHAVQQSVEQTFTTELDASEIQRMVDQTEVIFGVRVYPAIANHDVVLVNTKSMHYFYPDENWNIIEGRDDKIFMEALGIILQREAKIHLQPALCEKPVFLRPVMGGYEFRLKIVLAGMNIPVFATLHHDRSVIYSLVE